jgi:hypothetical protein
VPTSRTVVRRNRSLLLPRLAVHGAARRPRHLCAGLLPLFAMHPRPAILLSAARFWRALFCPELYNTSIMLVYAHGRRHRKPVIEGNRRASVPGHAGKGREAMTLPRFNAETSLYKTSVHYRLMDASVQADGVMLQQFRLPGQPFTVFCDPCAPNNMGTCAEGACVQNCFFCVGNRCSPFTEQCNDVDQTNCCHMQCSRYRGVLQRCCYCECYGGSWDPDLARCT